ncbi:MAG: tRNA (guanosine(46)-N7)-methyltransferase TrmB [Gammaproteobacteria bacterium]|nr:tRNA (guanosine(46)-N7)-methyltransferase TrmB [Gammaproteobacteria bacterium]
MATSSQTPFRLRSFVRRDSRITFAQERAHHELWPQYGLSGENGLADYEQIFGRIAPCFLEIGFGSGQSLLALAKSQPDKDFIGVETHKPGIGALLLGMQANAVSNLRVYHADVIDVLQTSIPNASLAGVQIFFPDPWPKRRHHARRLIQTDFILLITSKLKPGGILYLATDWDDYAKHMMRIVSQQDHLTNLAGVNQFAARSPHRPILTKFEQRALREGRKIWELQFSKV